ncbi:MAG TPA: glycosyltransferase family 4 protein [Gemmatimonadaceae bacterium]|nr:glycosyltransferase family 4 protein [Gemmatimonadaceae bacterium]
MKVALVCDWYRPRIGGIELHLQDLAKRLVDAGHDVVAITATPGEPVCDGIRVRRIDAPRAPRFGFLITRAGIRAVGHAIADEAPDVAHCHVSIVSPTALGGALHSVRRGIPTVLTFHSIVPQTPLLARAVGTMLGSARWPAVFTAVSARVAGEVQPFAGEREVSVLSNGIDAKAWRTATVTSPDGRLELISVMRLNPKKRPLALVRMLRDVRSRLGDDFSIRLRIVGDGPELGALTRAVSRAGLERHVELLGRCSRARIRELLAESHVFVLPTVRESFGLAALEARCAGVPVVAMAASGVAELITHGREGLLAQSDEELAAHVAALARDRGRLREMAEFNARTAPPHDWPRVIDTHLAVYRDAIALREKVRAETNE